mmetsp:Transcript_3264/g.9416  ORF Transcript_3264/g.9416 Transcript_3264/m.9416 type:complete len:205 (-) Transcript_3264:262-876(-)
MFGSTATLPWAGHAGGVHECDLPQLPQAASTLQSTHDGDDACGLCQPPTSAPPHSLDRSAKTTPDGQRVAHPRGGLPELSFQPSSVVRPPSRSRAWASRGSYRSTHARHRLTIYGWVPSAPHFTFARVCSRRHVRSRCVRRRRVRRRLSSGLLGEPPAGYQACWVPRQVPEPHHHSLHSTVSSRSPATSAYARGAADRGTGVRA